MYLFFDTETTGLPRNWKAPLTDLNNWPRLVQLAYLYYDSNGHLISHGDFIIKPEGFTIPLEASRIHGISTDKAIKDGQPITFVLEHFNSLVEKADFLVAHNMSFDEKIVGAEFLRHGMQNSIQSKNKICTMESAINFCAIDGPHGYKWPKLSELHHKLFGTDFEEAHNAAADIKATAKCFWELKRLGNLITPVISENTEPVVIDNIELDKNNAEFNYASEFVKNTDKLIYLTGKAGTGKTTFLKHLRETTKKNIVILAPTGVAAVNAGGQTIHSFFLIPPSTYVPNDKRLRIKPDTNDPDRSTIYDHFQYNNNKLEVSNNLELLVIDEISMVRCDLLDVIDRLLRVFRKKLSMPFGGVQVILIGDTFQLPPIAKRAEWDILNIFYTTKFFFGSRVIQNNKPIYIELKKIYRQNEEIFIDLLNRIRKNQITTDDLEKLNSRFIPHFIPEDNHNYITISTHNRKVNNTNLTKLAELDGDLKKFEGAVTGIFPDDDMPTDRILQLKQGAQIMFIKNDTEKRYFNGKIAKIKTIEDNNIIAVFSGGEEITVEKQSWTNIRYQWNEEERKVEEVEIGRFIQYPIKLAWAITVHKSQGLTFENVVADLGNAFLPGQVYVALSRCKTFHGLVLQTKINREAIKTDPEALSFAKNEIPSTLIIKELNNGKADFYYKKTREAIKNCDFNSAYNDLIQAIKIRNDIETNEFKKYFITTALRISAFKNKYTKLNSKYEDLMNEKEMLEVRIDREIEDKFNTLNEMYDQFQSLLESSEKLENLLKNKESEIKEKSALFHKSLCKRDDSIAELEKLLKNKENEIKDNSARLQRTICEKDYSIAELEKLLINKENEIIRLRNLSWHQKLFGKK